MDETFAKSYRYVRLAIIALLLGLGVSVLYQTEQQHWLLLASVSAYYYTPAQGIFVGALTALAACMIALRGTSDAEDVLLNLGGMFAVMVAVVPTARGADYQTAKRLCDKATDNLPSGVDCPTIKALAAATRANVGNNMIALLVLGLVGLLVVGGLLARHRQWARLGLVAWVGVGAAIVIYLTALVTFFAARDWFIDHAHFIAASSLAVCIIGVAIANAYRRHPKGSPKATPRNRYSVVAVAMIVVSVVGAILFFTGAISLFWLEIAVAAMFLVLWTVQTVEQSQLAAAITTTAKPPPPPPPPPPTPVAEPVAA
jgi:hypothetical protein